MKNLLIVTGIYPPEIGGPATYVSNIVPYLEKKGFNIHILTLGDVKSNEKISYISRKSSFFKRSYLIKRFIEKRDFDTIYVQDPFSVGFGVALSNTKARKIMKIVGDNVWEISRETLKIKDSIDNFQNKKYSLKIKLMKKIQKYSASKMDSIITPSAYLKTIVSNWGVDEKRINVIFNAIENIEIKNLDKKYNRKNKIFLTVARLAPWKGVDLLIDIFKERDDELIIIGDGPQYTQFKKKIEGASNIKLLGRLNKQEVFTYYEKSDVFILNSGYEGLPHVVIEAFEFNCPVLLSNVCGNPEIVEDKYNGLLFEYNNKESIIKAIESLDEKSCNVYTSNAKKSLKKFDFNLMLKNTIKILEK